MADGLLRPDFLLDEEGQKSIFARILPHMQWFFDRPRLYTELSEVALFYRWGGSADDSHRRAICAGR